jgi:hypothetical protein
MSWPLLCLLCSDRLVIVEWNMELLGLLAHQWLWRQTSDSFWWLVEHLEIRSCRWWRHHSFIDGDLLVLQYSVVLSRWLSLNLLKQLFILISHSLSDFSVLCTETLHLRSETSILLSHWVELLVVKRLNLYLILHYFWQIYYLSFELIKFVYKSWI